MNDLDRPGLDTWLARLLLNQGLLDVHTLRRLLDESRRARAAGAHATLARRIVAERLLPAERVIPLLQPAVGPSAVAWREGGRVGEYLLEARLGAGGMGTVWRARHLPTGAARALKALSAAGADAALRARFAREGQAHAALSAHPNVVTVHEAGTADGLPYLVMELLEGGSLFDVLRRGPLPIERAVDVALALAEGLAAAHDGGILHRDLKPENVLLDPAGTPKLADFGLAAVVGEATLTQTGDLLGTPAYMAPEQALGKPDEMGPATDVYGLGAILYHTLTGRPPFAGGRGVLATLHEVATAAPAAVRSLRPDCPPQLEAICLRCLAKAPAARYPTARALGDDLGRFRRGEAVTAHPGRRGRWLAAALALTLAGSLGLAVALGRPRSAQPEPIASPPARGPSLSQRLEALTPPAGDAPFSDPVGSPALEPAAAGAETATVAARPTLAALAATPDPPSYPGARGDFVRHHLEPARAGGVGEAFQVANALLEPPDGGPVRVRPDFALGVRWMVRAAAAGHGRAAYRLSVLLQPGAGAALAPSPHAAQAWLLRAAAEGFAPAMTQLGQVWLRHGDAPRALAWFRHGAHGGHTIAMNFLAHAYAHADGLEGDSEVAAGWVAASARRDDALANDVLGGRPAVGPGLEQLLERLDRDLGRRGRERVPPPLPERSGPPTLAELVATPPRTSYDEVRHDSIRLNLAAALDPSSEAAPIHAAKLADDLWRLGEPWALAEAVRWDFRAALAGSAHHGMVGLSDVLLDGRIVERDVEAVAAWLGLASHQGAIVAKVRLGELLLEGVELPGDPARAFGLLQEAADAGDLRGQAALGSCYWRGRGVERDPRRAVELLEPAAAEGNPTAMRWLSEACFTGEGTGRPPDPTRGLRLLEAAAAELDQGAARRLVERFRDGIGVTQDPARLRDSLRGPAERGEAWAREALQALEASGP